MPTADVDGSVLRNRDLLNPARSGRKQRYVGILGAAGKQGPSYAFGFMFGCMCRREVHGLTFFNIIQDVTVNSNINYGQHIRSRLQRLGLSPRRALGQHFLIDQAVLDQIILAADIGPDDTVIEIGPGLGTLTGALLKKGAKVYSIEKDILLIKYLGDTLAASYPSHFFLSQGDAVQNPMAGFNPQSGERFKIISNLPYAIATPWIDEVLEGSLPVSMVLMLQKEMAGRLTSMAGTKNFGAISIFLQSAYEHISRYKVSGRCFFPVPSVDSVLINLVRKKNPFIFQEKAKDKIRMIFTQRRKQIRTLQKNYPEYKPWIEYLEASGVKAEARPETISLEHWQKFDEYF